MSNLKQLEIQIEELIKARPSLKAYQNEINLKLMHLDDPNDRMAVIVKMAQDKMQELKKEMNDLALVIKGV